MKVIEHSGGRLVLKLSPSERRMTERARWQQYEQRKREWCDAHPDATAAEFDHAMRRIARDLYL